MITPGIRSTIHAWSMDSTIRHTVDRRAAVV
jgi:hypothetical protein